MNDITKRLISDERRTIERIRSNYTQATSIIILFYLLNALENVNKANLEQWLRRDMVNNDSMERERESELYNITLIIFYNLNTLLLPQWPDQNKAIFFSIHDALALIVVTLLVESCIHFFLTCFLIPWILHRFFSFFCPFTLTRIHANTVKFVLYFPTQFA